MGQINFVGIPVSSISFKYPSKDLVTFLVEMIRWNSSAQHFLPETRPCSFSVSAINNPQTIFSNTWMVKKNNQTEINKCSIYVKCFTFCTTRQFFQW